ncbi:hypothetical protein [Maricaulis sp.]|uniref:hypothetical protein n=1 Tax=Maricaulis sp. TaxID=1486257 RepID=UPI002600015A|nr:hypothetical protein [Maricaulis sp.]MDF1769655.1 hypothetical protein [Maricaulis sp.]
MSLVTAAQLRGLLIVAEGTLSAAKWQFWEGVMIEPETWRAPAGTGFDFAVWVVAVQGHHAVWFNSVANCFELSPFSRPGQLEAPSRARGELANLVDQLTG